MTNEKFRIRQQRLYQEALEIGFKIIIKFMGRTAFLK